MLTSNDIGTSSEQFVWPAPDDQSSSSSVYSALLNPLPVPGPLIFTTEGGSAGSSAGDAGLRATHRDGFYNREGAEGVETQREKPPRAALGLFKAKDPSAASPDAVAGSAAHVAACVTSLADAETPDQRRDSVQSESSVPAPSSDESAARFVGGNLAKGAPSYTEKGGMC
jgi:hypothetical protein